MKDLNDTNWTGLQGFNSAGLLIKERLGELLSGALPYEEQVELFVDLCRDGVASNAGYAAIPFLVCNQVQNPFYKWQMAQTACLIIGAIGKIGSSPVPENLLANVDEENRKLAIKTILTAGAEAELGPPELLDTLSAVLAVQGRTDLADTIGDLALAEYGVGLSNPA